MDAELVVLIGLKKERGSNTVDKVGTRYLSYVGRCPLHEEFLFAPADAGHNISNLSSRRYFTLPYDIFNGASLRGKIGFQ
jgi:hypothetical protein